MQNLEELKLQEVEALQHLDMLDIIFNTDCTMDGVPLTKEQWDALWQENVQWERKLNNIRLKIYFLEHPLPENVKKCKSQQLHTHINTEDDSECDTNLHPKKDTELEL